MAAVSDAARGAVQHAAPMVPGVVARAVREYNPQSLPESAPQCRIVQARRAADLPAE